MGRDKALVEVGGRPLATIARDALVAAGAAEVFAVGGDADGLRALDFTVVPDRFPGEGPLGGLVTALGNAEHDVVVVLACDLPDVTGDTVAGVLGGLRDDADAAAPELDGHLQVLLAAYRRRCLPTLETALIDGERAVHRALVPLAVARVALADPRWARNANAPGDLT